MISNNMTKQKRGRPSMNESEKKQPIGTKVLPHIARRIKSQPSQSAYIEKLVQKDIDDSGS